MARLVEENVGSPSGAVVLGVPRGGVPVAAEVARRLGSVLDVVVARKIGAPGQPELGIGAIAEGDVRVVDASAAKRLGVDRSAFDRMAEREEMELERRVRRYRSGRVAVPVSGRVAVVVDDGLATGVSAEAAVASVRQRDPTRIVLAVPVGSPDAVDRLAASVGEVVCVRRPSTLRSVGQWYVDFTQTSDDEVLACLAAGGQTIR